METPQPKQVPAIKEKVLSRGNFAYWQHLKEIFKVVRDVIRSDRERDFSLHIDACRAMTLNTAFDRINF